MPKAQFMRESIDKQGFIKIKNSVLWKSGEWKDKTQTGKKKYLQEMLLRKKYYSKYTET